MRCRILFVFLASIFFIVSARQPHIIFIIADDLGWNDVGFHGSNQIPTPNIDALAYSGKILNNYYVDPICTPSRSALMTGLHPIHTGLQHHTIPAGAPYGLPLNIKILPEYLNDLGYESHAVGKWHLGSHRKEYTPTYRGFKTHHGYWQGMGDYYGHTFMRGDQWGYDFYKNMTLDYASFGKYSTHIFTETATSLIHQHDSKKHPLFLYIAHQAVHSANGYETLQAPSEDIKDFEYIKDEKRRVFAAEVKNLDKSVGRVVEALQKKNMLKDSIIVFTTDNGGPAAGFNSNAASNWPLKGVKDTLWEGGVRGSSFIWNSKIAKLSKISNHISMDLMNIQDWLPTFYAAAGGNVTKLPMMDGFNLWPTLTAGKESPRKIMLHNIDDERHVAAIRMGPWKLVKGTTYAGEWDGWYGPSGRNSRPYNISSLYSSPTGVSLKSAGYDLPKPKEIPALRKKANVECPKHVGHTDCKATESVCLFNLTADPCERNNLAFKLPIAVELASAALQKYEWTAVPPLNEPVDKRSFPKYWDYAWVNWMDHVSPGKSDPAEGDETLNNHYVHYDFFIQMEIQKYLHDSPDIYLSSGQGI